MTEVISPKATELYGELKAKYAAQDFVNVVTRKDIRAMGTRMTDAEARLLVGYYYLAQENRKRFENQVRSLKDQPNMLLSFLGDQSSRIEEICRKALDDYTMTHPMGAWLRGIHGIGPVLAAGLLAHIDISKSKTAGHIWSFAGYNPNMVWEKGQKRPFNMALKVLCFKIGDSFLKTSGSEKAYYGKLYQQRKAYEVERNETGQLAHRAEEELQKRKYSKETETYKCLIQGKLSPGHLDARARRWAVKIMLSHLQAEWWRREFNEEPPVPYALEHKGHVHYIEPPPRFDKPAKPGKKEKQ